MPHGRQSAQRAAQAAAASAVPPVLGAACRREAEPARWAGVPRGQAVRLRHSCCPNLRAAAPLPLQHNVCRGILEFNVVAVQVCRQRRIERNALHLVLAAGNPVAQDGFSTRDCGSNINYQK